MVTKTPKCSGSQWLCPEVDRWPQRGGIDALWGRPASFSWVSLSSPKVSTSMWLNLFLPLGRGRESEEHTFSYENVSQKFYLIHSCSVSQMASLVAKEAEECWNLRSYLLKRRQGMAIRGKITSFAIGTKIQTPRLKPVIFSPHYSTISHSWQSVNICWLEIDWDSTCELFGYLKFFLPSSLPPWLPK